MNRLNEKQNEKGSVLVEVIAVIALLGVMGPLLFRQVMTRNEEVENINSASEMRTLKEAFSAYILTYKAQLLNIWSQETTAEEEYCPLINGKNIEAFLPFGNDAYKDYNFYLCKNSDNFLQGYITPTLSAMPEDVGLKRAARIANLIGADAAICYKNGETYNINGVAGGWGLDGDPDNWCDAGDGKSTVYLVTTGMDTYVPEVTYEDYSTGVVSIPNRLALQDLHAWNYFSVGSGSNCYTLHHDKTGNYDPEKGFVANDDEIRDVNDSGCDPLFWVSSVSGSDDKAKGEVYVKNNLMVGRATDGTQKQAIGLFHADTTSGTVNDTTYDETRSAGNKIVVYDNTGKEKITINGKGEIIAGDTEDSGVEKMTMTNQGLESSVTAKNAKKSSGESENYKVDPAYTSVMNDIKLDSRGGARLSDILPNYISRGIFEIGGVGSSSSSITVPVPDCPEGYAAAVIVTPTVWKNKPTVSKEEVEAKLKTKEIDIPKEGGKIESVGITMEENQNLEVQNADFKITISGEEKSKSTVDNGHNWTIQFLNANAQTNSTKSEDLRTDVKGLAQTFCVYDSGYNGNWSTGKKPDTDKLERPTH